MTKKDYELIARVFNGSKQFLQFKDDKLSYHNGKWDEHDTLARNLAMALAQQNPNFNKSKFLEACGLEV